MTIFDVKNILSVDVIMVVFKLFIWLALETSIFNELVVTVHI